MQPAVATVSALTSNQRALLPIVQVDIVGTGRVTRKANALLDSGAQISLIRSSLAEDLKLRGKSVVVTITKVGGEEEELKTMMYRVQRTRHRRHRNPVNQRRRSTGGNHRYCEKTWL